MNEKFKMFFAGVGSALAFAGSIVLSILFQSNRRRVDAGAGERIEQARAACNKTTRAAEQLADSTERAIRTKQDIERTNKQLANSINTSRAIFEEFKKRQRKK